MDPNFLCPICKKDNCFVCKYWNDNELMDLLLSENGALVFDLNYMSYSIVLWTLWFCLAWITNSLLCVFILSICFIYRWNGKVETTIGELYSVFQRNGFIPYGITSFLNELQSEGKITIKQKEEKKRFDCLSSFSYRWYSYLFSFFSSSTVIDYLWN